MRVKMKMTRMDKIYLNPVLNLKLLPHPDAIMERNPVEEKLTTATKILTGADEKEISVATNLRRIVNRLPNDLVSKWQNVNYEILSRGSSARFKDISDFVRKHATIRNDPVYGLPKRENKDTKGSTKTLAHTRHPIPRPSTVATANVQKDVKVTSTAPEDRCEVCKGSRHNLKVCPTINQCDHVDVRRQYAAAYHFCFNCGKQRPGHASRTCPETPSCTHCNDRHLEILHKDKLPFSQNPPPPGSDKAPTRDDKKPGHPLESRKLDPKPQSKEYHPRQFKTQTHLLFYCFWFIFG